MNHSYQSLYEEIAAMKKDLEEHLKTRRFSAHVQQLAEEELSDLTETLEKWEKGDFGICEETGSPLPEELIMFQPTVRSISEAGHLLKYLKKPVYPI